MLTPLSLIKKSVFNWSRCLVSTGGKIGFEADEGRERHSARMDLPTLKLGTHRWSRDGVSFPGRPLCFRWCTIADWWSALLTTCFMLYEPMWNQTCDSKLSQQPWAALWVAAVQFSSTCLMEHTLPFINPGVCILQLKYLQHLQPSSQLRQWLMF